MNHTLRSPRLWIGATALSGLLYFFAFHFFPQTFPLIHLDITMNLEQALEQADEIAQTYNIGPRDYHDAAMFHTDTAVKTFVELEAGGTRAFVAMMDEKLYMPYTWRVRHFKKFEKNETTIIFTPDGTPYGFIETVSDNTPGAQLSEQQARTLAEDLAAQNWHINFDGYTLIESSQKTVSSARIDHTFVYELTNKTVGEGRYRLKIVVSGAAITEVNHFVKVPEAFIRRYTEMYSANNTIAFGALLIMILLYCIGGCCFGLFWIMKNRLLILKQPFKWGLFLSIANALVSINQLPFLWMHYNSAYSLHGFFAQLFLSFFIQLILQTGLLTLIIATAESLTRAAFGSHPQLWSLWSTQNAASYAVLGRALGGYLMVGFNCAFVIACYLFATRYLHWWTPSDMLFDPNILATYAPWFTSLARSLNAGIMEECLFRAIPLAGAALLGTYYGKKNWWIAAALILQAVVFGAAHANYPTQPSYARLIELFIPSLIWGITYLRWGLLPTIITHAVYDIIWFSLPIFASHAPYVFIYKTVIIVITLLPLLYIMYARIRQKSWTDLSNEYLNAAWKPSAAIPHEPEQTIATPESPTLSQRKQQLIIILGICGLIAWLWKTPFVHDGITISIDRSTAMQETHAFLQHNNIVMDSQWKTLPLLFSHYNTVPSIALQHKFIWQEGSAELYHAYLGTYLEPAHWTIRYAQFDTDLVQRSEEYKIMLYDNTIWRYHHQLPETSSGAVLPCEQARTIAHRAVQQKFNIDPAQLIEISAEQKQLPNRCNWLFIFTHPTIYPLQTGQARINVLIAGDEVIDMERTIHVPEEWERTEQNRNNILSIITTIFSFILAFFILIGLYIASRRKKTVHCSKPLFFILLSITVILSIIGTINVWPTIVGSFNTNVPLLNQIFQSIASIVIINLVTSALLAAAMAYAITYALTRNTISLCINNNALRISIGICIGLFWSGIMSIAHALIPTNLPLWPHYDSLIGTSSWLHSLLHAITNYLYTTTAFSLLFLLVDWATYHWRKNRLFYGIMMASFGIATLTLPSIDMITLWLAIGTIIGIIALALYHYILQYDFALIPLATGSFIIMNTIQQGIFNAYPGAGIEAIINICMTTILAGLWYWFVQKQTGNA